MSFFGQLNFSSANEDGASELAALCTIPPRRLLCLTGSGTRVFDMLLGDPGEVIALDLNPFQNELLRLKMAAFSTLSDAEVFDYLGISGTKDDRIRLHASVSVALPPESRGFWQTHAGLVARGVWYAGLWEKVLCSGARLTRLIRGPHVDRLFAAATIEDQANIWTSHFDDWFWRASIRLLGRPWVWTHVIGEPGGAFLPSPAEVERRLAGAFNHAVEAFRLRESDFASLILRGRHELPYAVPLHMQPGNIDTVRQRLSRIRIVQGRLDTLPTSGIGDVDAFSLSDFGSYCTQEAYDACWAGVIGAAAPGARVCEREFMNGLSPPHSIDWDHELSARLTARDKSFIYRIRAGTIAKEASA